MAFELRHIEPWPLWTGLKRIWEGRVWMLLDEVPDLRGRPEALRHLLSELRRLEHQLQREGLVGWLQCIQKGNSRMARITEMSGATLYAQDETHWHYYKLAGSPPLPKTVREGVQRWREAHAGTV